MDYREKITGSHIIYYEGIYILPTLTKWLNNSNNTLDFLELIERLYFKISSFYPPNIIYIMSFFSSDILISLENSINSLDLFYSSLNDLFSCIYYFLSLSFILIIYLLCMYNVQVTWLIYFLCV